MNNGIDSTYFAMLYLACKDGGAGELAPLQRISDYKKSKFIPQDHKHKIYKKNELCQRLSSDFTTLAGDFD